MNFLNATNHLYGWLSTLIRRTGKRKSIIEDHQASVKEDSIKNSDELIPTLNFIASVVEPGNKIAQNAENSDIEKRTDNNFKKNIGTRNATEIPDETKIINMDDSNKQSSDNSIAEEIEEELITGGESSSNHEIRQLQNIALKKQRLFDIDPGPDDDDHFKIDEEQLSGGKLAQHFQIAGEDEPSQEKHKKYGGKSSDKSELSPFLDQKDDQSLTNQSTANDVSELIDEISDDHKELHTRSLELSSNYVNYEKRDFQSLEANVSFADLTNPNVFTVENDRKDHSMEEKIEEHQSTELTLSDDGDLSELNPNIDILNEALINKILEEPLLPDEPSRTSVVSATSTSSSQDDNMDKLKQKILSLKQCPRTAGPHMARDVSFEQTDEQVIVVKQMEKVHADYSKEILEDITEESEKSSFPIPVNQPIHDDQNTSHDSVISLNMIQMLEDKVKELEGVVNTKDVCLASLNMQLDAVQRRESYAITDRPASGRDSSSLATVSTEYRTLQDDIAGNKLFDFHNELTQRDNLIEKLTDSLQQSMLIRDNIQQQSDKLSTQLEQLRKQLNENPDLMKKPIWARDQESNCQRLSQISMDLVSESDEDLERNFLTDNEEKLSRSSKDRQQFIYDYGCGNQFYGDNLEPEAGLCMTTASKQIEQFQKYLNPDELRIFFMVQKKFEDFLFQELEKQKMKNDNEIKILADQLEAEKHDRDLEINRLKQVLTSIKDGSSELIELRKEMENIHTKEMEELRLYFEQKCTDLEKQFSEEVFSQQSQRNDQSDISDQENLPKEIITRALKSKEGSPKKRTREELYAIPSYLQMTPTTLSLENEPKHFSFSDVIKSKDEDPEITTAELQIFYKEKIQEFKLHYDKIVKKLTDRLKRFETKHADDEFMKETLKKIPSNDNKPDNSEEQNSSYIIIDEDEIENDGHEIGKIAAEYDRRLKEQVRLAKEDIIRELEQHIQALLSETTTDDHNWPPELILLREKFTAKSQLEIAQLQIKHEEEMSRLKIEFEKQLNRKIKRQSTFDLSRDLDQIISEREGLRELSSSFRYILCELAKYVTICDSDLNTTFNDELQKIYQQQADVSVHEVGCGGDTSDTLQTTVTRRLPFVPDVSNLLNVIEDPQLLSFISQQTLTNFSVIDSNDNFNLKDCIDKLRTEAQQLLELSENFHHIKKEHKTSETSDGLEKNDSCEEEDGLKSGSTRSPNLKVLRAHSMNEHLIRDKIQPHHLFSLPPDLNRLNICSESMIEDFTSTGPVSELNFHVHELKNRLVKSESDRVKLQHELEATIKRNCELGVELTALRDQLEQLDSNKEDYSEGYGIGDIKSPQRVQSAKILSTSFSQLQERARNLLSTPTRNTNNNTSNVSGDNTLLQIIEEFCREGDKVVEDSKKDREDLQAQIDAADKQLKATRQFLEDQAAERELERDEFVKEIEQLKFQLRDKEKERHSLQNVSKEVEQMDHQIKELTAHIAGHEAKKDKLEIELKASIDKIFVLREIISELETQVETKALNEHVLNEKLKELELYIGTQNRSNETLQNEVEILKTEIGQGYQERITSLEEMLGNSRPSAEQNALLRQFGEQLRDIATTLDQKTKTLEAIHQNVASVSCSTSPSEDLSAAGLVKDSNLSPIHGKVTPNLNSLPIDEIQKVFEKLSKHTRIEEAAIKRIKDLEMHIGNIRNNYGELQQERDVLQDRMAEQMTRISNLQSKLEEQRRRAEDLQRIGTTDLNIRIHDLQSDVENLNETLSVRDKQINNLKNHLKQSKSIIDRQEAELAMGIQSDRSITEKLEAELKLKNDEIKRLKDKIKSEMINKLALPDLMETMLADKNEEIDHLKDQLESKEKELQDVLEINLSQDNNMNQSDQLKEATAAIEPKLSARTLSDIISISEYDEPDVIRRAPLEQESPLTLPEGPYPEQTMESSKLGVANLTQKRTEELTMFNTLQSLPTFDRPNFFTDPSIPSHISSANSFCPRQINFSEFIEESKLKESTPKVQEENSDVKTFKHKLIDAENQIESLKIALNILENGKNQEIVKIQEELEKKCKQYEQLEKENLNFRTEMRKLESLIEKISHLENDVQFKAQKLINLEEDFIANQLRFTQIEDELNLKCTENTDLKSQVFATNLENETLAKKLTTYLNTNQEFQKLTQQLNEKDEILKKHIKNIQNLQESEASCLMRIAQFEEQIAKYKKLEENAANLPNFKEELSAGNCELSEKVLLYEKALLDIQAYQKELERTRSNIMEKDNIISSLNTNSKSLQNIVDSMQQKIDDSVNQNDFELKFAELQTQNVELEKRNSTLETELEKLRSQSSDNSKPYSLDEIAQQVEKELNYSAQLDSNILKAIESEEENNFGDHVENDSETKLQVHLNEEELQLIRAQLQQQKKHSEKIQKELNDEKLQSQEIQQQDVAIIEAMRIRLEEAMSKEHLLHRKIDEEREKCERLAAQISVLQRSEARRSSLLLKSPPDSPRKSPRSLDFENEVADRLKSEIKLLNAQNEREKERVVDLQRVLDRERNRFEAELNERIDYSEKLKREMEKFSHEKETNEQEIEHLEERLALQSQEIESLENRIVTLQESETRRTQRRDREINETTQNVIEVQEMKAKLAGLEVERDQMTQTVAVLRGDIERGAQREMKLAEALGNSNSDGSLSQLFLAKMKEINVLLAENTKENRQMAETVHILIEERKTLQRKCDDLESHLASGSCTNVAELEERANHLLGRYLRVESHRKALVHQKRYLLISLQSYQDSEGKAAALLNGRIVPRQPKSKNRFKIVGLAVIAIQRMKFVVKRWHTGKRIVSKSVFTITQQKRNGISGNPSTYNVTPTSKSPPCRDTPPIQNSHRSSQAPALLTEFQFTAPPHLPQTQKIDWTRIKYKEYQN